MKTITPPEYVSIGKDYNSIKRAEEKTKSLINRGYQCIKNTGKRMTFVKN